ncbi:MAG: GntR family transcriptional regulator [Clostridia bacterium]|nr:GntR family transcriptional regulator [Clostridia bacterium]
MAKESNADIAYDYIKNGVISKIFFPGNRLIEEEIVRETGVSRSSVRAALSRLKYEGIVEGTPNHGMSVSRFQQSDIQSVFHVRRVLETSALELAMPNFTPAILDRMRQKNDELRKVMEHFNISEYVIYNRDFHWEIALASRNRYYQKFLDEVYNTIAVCLLFYNNTTEDRRSLQYHQELIDAIERGDLEAAKQAVIKDNNCAIEDANCW